MRTTPDNITQLAPNEVFVFGSNLAGIHGAGAALLAARRFGATRGIGIGRMGQSYGIPTKDRNIRTLPLGDIEEYVEEFLFHAAAYPDTIFLTTPVGCGLAGYEPDQIAPFFKGASANVILPFCFSSRTD